MLCHSKLESTGLAKIKYEYRDLLNIKNYINWRTYTKIRDNEQSFLNRRRYYLSRPPYIPIKSYDNKDEHFLSALVNCHLFNDKFVTVFYCPCNRAHKEWMDKFCFFRDDIIDCKDPHDFNSPQTLYEHCEKVGKECRWHQLCFKFMQKVFFRKDDDFVSDSNTYKS